MSDQVKVVIRVRPLIQREENSQMPVNWIVENDLIKQIDRSSSSRTNQFSTSFQFDRIFDASCSNRFVYTESVQPIVKAAMQGFNGTIFAYGQTSSGKTYTIMGCDEQWGVIPYSIAEIFETIENSPNREFLLRVSYMEIYNESVMDLFSGEKNMKVKEMPTGDVYVANLKEEIVRSPEMIFSLLEKGEAKRHFGETNMNDKSSRSHTIFRIVIESRELKIEDIMDVEGGADSGDGIVNVSHLNIVDLAGSERTGQTGATGDRFKEGCAINKSLFTLSQVISKLSDVSTGSASNDGAFVNFRDSKLTRILQNSFGGNSKTAIICTVTPAAIEETSSTLKFASRAKIIKNRPVKNEVISDETMLRRCQKQINELKKQIHDLAQTSNVYELQQEKDNLTKLLTEKEEKIEQLMRLFCMSSKINLSPSSAETKVAMKNRRITWCPGSKNFIQPLPSFSPFRFNRRQNLSEIPEQASFMSVDKESLLREFDTEERLKCAEISLEADDSVNASLSFHVQPPCKVRRVNFLTPVVENCEDGREIACQTENFIDIPLESLSKNLTVFVNEECQTEEITKNPDSPTTAEVQELSNICETLMTEKQQIEKVLSATNKEMTNLRADFEFVSHVYADLQASYDKLKAEYEEKLGINPHLNSTAEFMQLEMGSLQVTCAEITRENEALSLANFGFLQTIEKLTKDRDDANKQCEELFMERWQADKKAASAEKERLRKEVAMENLSSEMEDLKAQLAEALANAAKVEPTVVRAETSAVEVQTDLDNSTCAELTRDNEALSLVNFGFLQTVEKLTKDRDDENKQCEELFMERWQADKKAASAEKERLRKEVIIENLSSEMKDLKAQLAEAVANAAKVEPTVVGAETSAVEVQTDLDNSIEKTSLLHAEIDRKNVLIHDMMNEVDRLQLKIRAAEASTQRNQLVHFEVQTEQFIVDAKETIHIEVQTENKSMCETENQTEMTMHDLESNVLHLEALNMALADLKHVTTEQLEQTASLIEEKNGQLANKQNDIAELERRLKTVNESEISPLETIRELNAKLAIAEESLRVMTDRALFAEHKAKLIDVSFQHFEVQTEQFEVVNKETIHSEVQTEDKSMCETDNQTEITMNDLDSNAAQLEAVCDDLRRRLSTALDDLEKKKETVESLKMALADLNQVTTEQLEQTEALIEEKNGELANKQNDITELERRLKNVNESAQEAEINRLEAVRELNVKLANVEESLRVMTDRALSAEHQAKLIDVSLSELESYKKNMFIKEKKIEQLKNSLESYKKKFEKACDQADEEENVFREKSAEYERTINELRKKATGCGDDEKRLVMENEKLRANVKKLFDELNESKMKVAELKSRSVRAEDMWRKRVAELENGYRSKQDVVLELKNKLREYEEKLRDSEPSTVVFNKKSSASSTSLGPRSMYNTATGSGIVDDHKVFLLETQVYQLGKTVEKLQKELLESKEEKECLKVKVLELEKENEKNISSLSSISASQRKNRLAPLSTTPKMSTSPGKKTSRIVDSEKISSSSKTPAGSPAPKCQQQ